MNTACIRTRSGCHTALSEQDQNRNRNRNQEKGRLFLSETADGKSTAQNKNYK